MSNGLTERDLAAFARICVPVEDLVRAGIRRVSHTDASVILGSNRSGNMAGVLFPYLHPITGRVVTNRLRRDSPELDNRGRLQAKYLSPFGDRRHPYFAPGAGEMLCEIAVPVVMVEAEKSVLAIRALAARVERPLLPIACGGCYGWKGKTGIADGPHGERVDEKGPLPDFSLVTWQDREVFICFDANAKTNPKVRQARYALGRELHGRGARVRIVELPELEGVNGPDDFVGRCGDRAFVALLDSASSLLASALTEAEAAIEAVSNAASDRKVGLIVVAMNAVADVADELHREVLGGLLAKAARGLVAKRTIADGISEQLRKRVEERADFERQLENAIVGPVDGAQVAALVVEFLRRYFVLPDHYFVILATWVMHTHIFECFDYTPYLAITSPCKRCGKSNLLTALGGLAARPWKTHSASVAVLARKIEKDHCTMILDEADQAFKGPVEYASALQGVLNSGFERSGTYSRCVGEGTSLEPKDFTTYCPKAIAAIKHLPDTVADRAIPLHLQRKNGEQVERFRSKTVKPEAAFIKKQVEIWADSVRAEIAFHEPQIVEEINDRAWDVCEPLMAIAECIGWEARLRAALLGVFGAGCDEDNDIGVQLLNDIRDIRFPPAEMGAREAEGGDRIKSAELVVTLREMGTAPWSDWNGGKGLTQNGLARMLKPFEVYPKTIRPDDGGKPAKGYFWESFVEVWARYLAPIPLSEALQPLQPLQPGEDASAGSLFEPLQQSVVTDSKPAKSPIKTRVVTTATDANAPEGTGHESDDQKSDEDFVEGTL